MFTCFSKIFEIVGKIDIGLQLEGSVLVPPLEIENIFACFNCDGNCPVANSLISAAIDDDKQFTDSLSSLGPIPSSPVALKESKYFYVSGNLLRSYEGNVKTSITWDLRVYKMSYFCHTLELWS